VALVSSSGDSSDVEAADETRTRPSVAARRDADALSASDIGADRLPSRIGKYRVTGYLGRGGMGVVLSAHDTELERPVALKLLHSTLGEKARSRMEREAQAMARLAHPNVVTVYEFGRAGDQPFIAMELVTGLTLREWFRREQRSWRKTLAMMIAAGRGLAAAHAAGMVHRDFKPDNVLVGADERPRVTDFGLVASSALEIEGAGAQDGASVMGGTPAYMPPEQSDAGEVDARADQYAFAVTCWEALWGSRPFAAQKERSAEPTRIRERRGVPRRVEVALRRALQSDRDKRWPKLEDLLDRLERIARDRRAAVAAVAVVSAAAIATIAFRVAAGPAESPCRSADSELGDLWSVAQQRALANAFAARPEPTARDAWADVQRTIDSWVADYRGLRVQSCEARRSRTTGSAPLSIARDRCLDRRRDELAALLAGLAQPDATTVYYARAAAHGLSRPISCLTVQSDGAVVADPPLAARDALGGIRTRLADAAAKRALGKPREAIAISEQVAKEADALGWAPIIALSQLELAQSLQSANRNEDGERAHERAALQADAAQDDETRFAATIGLAIAGMDHSRYDEAGKAIETARMIARRLPADERRDVTIDIQETRLAFWRGDYDTCITRGKATLARIASVLGTNAVEGASLREKVAHCLIKQDKYDEANALEKEGLAIAEASVGREHPVSAELIYALAWPLAVHGKLEEALAMFRDALAIRERVLGADNAIVGLNYTGIGDVLGALGRLEEARQSYARAIAILVPTWGADSPAVGIAELGMGNASYELKDYDAAVTHYRNSLAIRRAKRPPGHDEISWMLVSLGRALIMKKDRAAIPLLQEAVDAYAKSPNVRPNDAAYARYYLGRALVELDNWDRGVALIKAACPEMEKAPDLPTIGAECQEYLKRHPKPAR
jgi:eukaryotic-like serine/threonine-protein kinase